MHIFDDIHNSQAIKFKYLNNYDTLIRIYLLRVKEAIANRKWATKLDKLKHAVHEPD